MHGYEMIKEIEERTEGAWTPSAGSIYPTLQMLEDEGLISGEESDGKRRFTLTDAGPPSRRRRPESRPPGTPSAPGPPLSRSTCATRSTSSTTRSARCSTPPTTDQQRRVRELLDETRRKIYAILAEES